METMYSPDSPTSLSGFPPPSCPHATAMSLLPLSPEYMFECEEVVEEVVCISSSQESVVEEGPPTPPESTTSSTSSSTSFVCKWANCDWPGSYDDLVDHIREIHVDLQPYHHHGDSESSESYVCLWEGCKAFNFKTRNKTWLVRHVLQHSGDKPFKCIIGDCGHRFKSESALSRHVGTHFSTTQLAKKPSSSSSVITHHPTTSQMPSCSSSSFLNSDANSEHGSDEVKHESATMMRAKGANWSSTTPNKQLSKKKKSKRKIVVRRCGEDFWDSSIMEIVQYRLATNFVKTNHKDDDSTNAKNDSMSSTLQPIKVIIPTTPPA